MQGADRILHSKPARNRVGLKPFSVTMAHLWVNVALWELWLQKNIRHHKTLQRENSVTSTYPEKWGEVLWRKYDANLS